MTASELRSDSFLLKERIFISGFRSHLVAGVDFPAQSGPASWTSNSVLTVLQQPEGGEEPGQSSVFSLQVGAKLPTDPLTSLPP